MLKTVTDDPDCGDPVGMLDELITEGARRMLVAASDARDCRVVDAAYEKRSITLSSNLHPAGFDELMPKTIANATVDRLLHHAHLVATTGDSIRLTQATEDKGVTPLTS